ncbi:hypothetical protein [Variovorax sp. MHTC-1]|uniref:hypothetical protein n=1 Tax=Variovorax sp. MHTC-1 TaxID=2495593 RepID=UPI000F8965A8|nr:hypothetical protein [Variovorax sp. MHTC-1]RST47363.1 hypothetical protein EJI01_27990 [Variovorax sp. MHTC-1]
MNHQIQRKFDYRGAVITIEVTGEGEQISAHADVHRGGEFAGRVALTTSQAERKIIFDKLDCKAKKLVDGLLVANKRDATTAASGHWLQ